MQAEMQSRIQWFPGHMHKARKAFCERLPDVDLVIEVVDARLPRSSSNPMLETLVLGRKPLLKVLNKFDLADVAVVDAWRHYFLRFEQTQVLALDNRTQHAARQVLQMARQMAPHRASSDKPLRMLICGVPNVGKSTLVNALAQRALAKTGNEAAITKAEQRIDLADHVILWDTPGMLWPKIEHAFCGEILAASGAIGRNAFDEEEACLGLLGVLARRYPEALAARYRFTPQPQQQDFELFEAIGRKMGMMRRGGQLDRQKTAERLLDDFRTGRLGRLTLETPQDWEKISAEIAMLRALDDEKKAARQAKKSKRLQKLEAQSFDEDSDDQA